MTVSSIGQMLAEKTFRELGLDSNGKPLPQSKKETPEQESRNWQDPNGYQYLAVWQNAALLRILVRKFTETLPTYQTIKGLDKGLIKGNSRAGNSFSLNRTLNSPLSSTLDKPLKSEHRLIAQMDDEVRSIIRNIEEGFKRPTTKEYLVFLGYSQASLEELRGDIKDCKIFGYLPSQPLSTLKETLGIDLRVTKGPHKGKGETYGDPAADLNHPYYKPLSTLNPQTLTHEIFMELINKTDYLLRQLVVSLENKLNYDKKYYQIEQVRLWSK